MKKTSSILFGISVFAILSLSACSEGELLDPNFVSDDIAFTPIDSLRQDRAHVGVAPSSVEEISSEEVTSSEDETLSSDDVTVSSDGGTSAASSVATSSLAVSSVAVSSVAVSSVVVSSVAVSSVAPSSSSAAVLLGTCENPIPFVAGNYKTTDVILYNGVKYSCAGFCNVPNGHTPVTYAFTIVCK